MIEEHIEAERPRGLTNRYVWQIYPAKKCGWAKEEKEAR